MLPFLSFLVLLHETKSNHAANENHMNYNLFVLVDRWASFCREIMGMLYPKIYDIFYFTGNKITAPNCPIDMLPHYNPSNGAQFFRSSSISCSESTKFGLPFFLKDYGPVFQEWSVTAHESRPGHHTQIQGEVYTACTN